MTVKPISKKDMLAKTVHDNYQILVVLSRMNISLGIGNKSIENVAKLNDIHPDALTLLINMFINPSFPINDEITFAYLPAILDFLRNSHAYFLDQKIPSVERNIHKLVKLHQDVKAEMLDVFYKKYIEEVTEHMEHENRVVFPYVEKMYRAYKEKKNGDQSKDFNIKEYDDHHDNLEVALQDLKNILILHLPPKNDQELRAVVLKQLFELESDLGSHTRIENDIVIPLVKKLETRLQLFVN